MIPFLDLKKINKPYEAAFQDKLKTVLDNGWYILGKEVETFEKAFAEYCQTKYCIGTGNGFDALVLIFKGYIQNHNKVLSLPINPVLTDLEVSTIIEVLNQY